MRVRWETAKRVLDVTATLAVLAVCLVILLQAAERRAAEPEASAAAAITTPPPSAPVLGDALPAIDGVDLAASPHTLILAVQSSCRFCSESMPFYGRLAASRPASVRLVAVAPDEPAAARAYLASHAFAPDAIAHADLPSLHVGGTPTLILTGPSGVVERVWVGRQTPDGEKDIAATLAALR
jgi:hypothetical protein